MADTTTTTVKMRADGKMTIPIEAREALGIDGNAAVLQLDIHLKKTLDDNDT